VTECPKVFVVNRRLQDDVQRLIAMNLIPDDISCRDSQLLQLTISLRSSYLLAEEDEGFDMMDRLNDVMI
jgi:hypothetical protein